MAMPIQNALKFPAMSPESTLSEAPPSREAVTTSRTCADSVEVKTFTSSGITAPASVPQHSAGRAGRDAVGPQPVRRRADRVARVVTRAVGDHARVARVVFLDVEDDLHQVAADVGDLGEDAAGDAQRTGAE